MKLYFENRGEQLEYELGVLKRESLDPQFTTYLNSVLVNLRSGEYDVMFLRRKLIENYDIYSTRMSNIGRPVESLYFRAIYGDMDAPEVKDGSGNPQTPSQTDASPYGNDTGSDTAPEKNLSVEEPQSAEEINESAEPKSFYQKVEEESASFNPQANYNPQPSLNPQGYPAPQPKNSAEYAIGAIVMSVVGSVFLLVGLVYLAVNYLDSFMQGMLMYVACFAVIGVSELIVRRRVPKLSSVFTAIGISGIFLSTVVNYRSLSNLSLAASAVILGVVAVLVCIFGYFRKSQIYSAIGFLAAFISSVAIGNDATGGEFLFITLGTLLISCLWLVFPVKKYYGILATVMMISEFLYVPFALGIRIRSDISFDAGIYKMLFVSASWVIIELVYFTFLRFTRAEGIERSSLHTANMVIVIALSFIYSIITIFGFNESDAAQSSKLIYGIVVFLIYFIPGLIFTVATYRSRYYYSFTYFVALVVTGILSSICAETNYFSAPVIIAFAIAMRIVSFKNPHRNSYKVMDIIIQIFILLLVLPSADNGLTTVEQYFGMAVITLGVLACLWFNAGFNTAVWIIAMSTIAFGSITVFLPEQICAATSMGIILVLTYTKNVFERFEDNNTKVFNWFALVYEVLFLGMASSGEFSAEQVITYSIAAIFGLAFAILILNREYGFPFAGKYIVTPVYLTYACFLAPFESGFVLSIILMVIAVVSVIIGFVLKEKSIRVYGLVLSIIICGKIALVDFASIGDIFAKTIMYILVGLLALSIGCIYMVLEAGEYKKNGKLSGIASNVHNGHINNQMNNRVVDQIGNQTVNQVFDQSDNHN